MLRCPEILTLMRIYVMDTPYLCIPIPPLAEALDGKYDGIDCLREGQKLTHAHAMTTHAHAMTSHGWYPGGTWLVQ
jgi:hypothetical protein